MGTSFEDGSSSGELVSDPGLFDASQVMESPLNNGAIPTDYMSALARYGTLQVSFELPRCESQMRTNFNGETAFCERGASDQIAYGNTLYQGIEQSIWGVELRAIKSDMNEYDPVTIPLEERCDACLGVVDGKGFTCCSCGVLVHKSCYGMGKHQKDSSQFRCDVCSTKGLKAPRCHLCNLSGGAMRFSRSDKVWVHCSCVFIAPSTAGITFGKPLRMGDPCGIRAAVSNAPGTRNCDACTSSKGLLVPCSFPKCYRYIHSRCATFHKGYRGTSFTDLVYYWLQDRRQYFNFISSFCRQHATRDYVLLAVQMHLRRRYVIRQGGSSRYRKYQTEVADMVRMATAVTTSALKDDEMKDDDGDEGTTIQVVPDPVMIVDPYINEPSLSIDGNYYGGSRDARDGRNFKQWMNYFKIKREFYSHYVPAKLVYNPDDDEILLDVPDQVFPSIDELPVVDVQTATGDASLDGSSSQFRSQRMMWQKFDIFRPIPYGPCADEVLENLDSNSRKKSVSEYVHLESNVLTCSDFLEPRELGEIYMQQILMGCKGIVSLLESLKVDVDTEIQAIPKNGAIPTLTDKKKLRFHVLVDTGRTSGFLIFKADKWFMEALDGGTSLGGERGNVESTSEASFALDEEVRQFVSHVQTEVVRNTYATGLFLSSNVGGVKELDVVSGIAEYTLKDDLRQLHIALNSAANDSDVMRLRRKAMKRNKSNISLKHMELEKFIVLTPLECELLRRCTLEMSHINEVNLKLAVMKNTISVSPNVSCLHVVDWETIVRHLQGTSRDAASIKSPTSRTPKHSMASSRPFSMSAAGNSAMPTNEIPPNLAPVPLIYLGKQTWPVVDDLNFVRCQKELTESELTTVHSQLRKIRQNIRENVLEMNSRQPKMNERLGFTGGILEKYEAMDRWSTLVVNFCRGLSDSLEPPSQPPTAPSSTISALPVVVTPKSSEVRNAAKKAEGIAEWAYCSVCFINSGNNLNPVYTCSRCFMSCHRNCYGVGRVGKDQDQNDYICRRCEYERRSMGSQWQTAFRSGSLLCSICGRGGGALKRCDGDEWSHVFCLLTLLPETVCTNYTTLEPWTLVGVSRWRRESACEICGIRWGFVLRCNDCDITMHPLCAWLHGCKFSTSSNMGYMSNLAGGEALMRDLHVTVQCNEHDEARQWQEFVTMRNKRFLNRDTAYSLFEGKDKRRKLRTLLPDCLASTDSLETTSVMPEVTETQQVVEEKRCGICFGTGSLIDFVHCPASVHYWCYVEQDFTSSPTKSMSSKLLDQHMVPVSLVCDVCRNKDQGAVCGICRVASGVLKQVPGTGAPGSGPRRYIHVICAICFPEALITLYRGEDVEAPVNEDEFVQCAVCHSSEGCMVRCFKEDCTTRFHALCGMLNRFTVESHCLDLATGPQYVAYCQQHSLLCKSVGNNVKLLLRFRRYLQLLKDLIGDLAAQDTVMRAWYRKRQELLNAEYPLASLIQKREK